MKKSILSLLFVFGVFQAKRLRRPEDFEARLNLQEEYPSGEAKGLVAAGVVKKKGEPTKGLHLSLPGYKPYKKSTENEIQEQIDNLLTVSDEMGTRLSGNPEFRAWILRRRGLPRHRRMPKTLEKYLKLVNEYNMKRRLWNVYKWTDPSSYTKSGYLTFLTAMHNWYWNYAYGYEDSCDYYLYDDMFYDEYDYTGAYPETNRRPRSSDSRPPRRHYASKGEVEDDYRRKKPIDVSDDS